MKFGVGSIGVGGGDRGGLSLPQFYDVTNDGGDTLIAPANAAWNFATGSVTIEGWVYIATGVNNNASVYDFRTAANADFFVLYVDTGTGKLRLTINGASGAATTTGLAYTLDQWMYVAAVFNTSTSKMYVVIDGVAEVGEDNSGVGALDFTSTQGFGITCTGAGTFPVIGRSTQTRVFKSVRSLAQQATDRLTNRAIGSETAYYQGRPGTGTSLRNEFGAAPDAAFGAAAAAPTWGGPYRILTSGGPV